MNFIIRKDADKEAVMTYIDRLPNCKEYDIRVKTRKTVHPCDLDAIYQKWLGIMSGDTGKDKSDLHDFFSQKFLGFSIKKLYGEEVLKESTTEDLGMQEFSDYLEKVNAFATVEMGIVLPRPEDIYWTLFEENNY